MDRVTAFILHPDMPGFERGIPLWKMGARGSNQAELHFRDVRVPRETVRGEVGEVFKLPALRPALPAARVALNNDRDSLLRTVAAGVLGTDAG